MGSYGEYCNSRLGELYWESRKHLPSLLQSSVAAVESRVALVGSPVMQALQARSQKLLLQVDTKVGQAASASASQIAVLFCASLCSLLASQLCSLLRLIVQACFMFTLQAVPSCALQPVCCTRWLTQACPQVDSLCSTAGYWLWPSSYRAHQALGQGLQLDSKAFARVGTAHDLDASQSTSSPPAGDSSSAASARAQLGPTQHPAA